MDGRFVELFDSRVIQKIRLLLPSWTKQLKNRVLLSTPKYVSRAVRKLGLPIKLYIARRKGLTEGRDVETLLQMAEAGTLRRRADSSVDIQYGSSYLFSIQESGMATKK